MLPRLTLLPFLITLFNSIILSKYHFKAFKGLFKIEEALLWYISWSFKKILPINSFKFKKSLFIILCPITIEFPKLPSAIIK